MYPGSACGDHSHRAGNTRAAEAAVTCGVLAEILLVIILGVVELGRRADLGGDRADAFLVQRLLVHLLRPLRGLQLLIAVRIDRRAVLRAAVIALAHALGRVV